MAVFQKMWLILLYISMTVQRSSSLECYTCVNGWTSKLCEQNIATCSAGEICSNTVERKQFEGRVFTKGCKDRDLCYDLQTLNDRKTCKDTPSTCVYCCSENLCNKGETIRGEFVLNVMINSIVVLVQFL